MNLNKKVAFYTLGCKVNQYETESIRNQLIKKGYESVNFEEFADVYVVNSCTVTSMADKKTKNILRRAKKINPESKLIVTGCYAQTNYKELMEIEEIDFVVGNTDKQSIIKLVDELDSYEKVVSHNVFENKVYEEYEFATLREMTRAYIKIQDGCNVFCSYCKIPYARGRSRSRQVENIILEIKKLIEEGFREFILIGINIGAYGEDFQEKVSFENLVKKICELNGVERIRFGSVYPDKISDEFVNLFQNKKVVPHIHVSLQSCDDTVLSMMRRKYGASLIREKLFLLREKVENIEFSADVIVGFPGETEKMFMNTYDLIKELEFCHLHVFQYSDRENTLAEKFENKIGIDEKKKRAEILGHLRESMSKKRREIYLGRELNVLIEEIKNGSAYGHSENYLKVKIQNRGFDVGKIYPMKPIELRKELLIGE
ncbi:MAG: tRNA (N(6)-L-threonylcarbamoyladenosine(37)-C(2))-methylthiotransferase MtaB [Fusobacteriaceae bacterium]